MASAKIPGYGYPVEPSSRLSASVLWELQRGFYDAEGLSAWKERGVPCYVTTNPFIAEHYARVVHAALVDSVTKGGWTLDPDEPLYVVELASGSGEFGFRFLRQMQALLRRRPIPGQVRVCFVMTDFAEKNLEGWESLACFEPFLADGSLDIARFDCDATETLRLRRSGVVLEQVKNPLIVFANYLFDSLPQDAFWIRDGALREGVITVTAPKPLPREKLAAKLPKLRWFFSEQPVDSACYGEPAIDAVLARYLELLDEASFLLPISTLRCLGRLLKIAAGRMLLLTSDKGYAAIDELALEDSPHLEIHGGGCFSLMVDFHALGVFCEAHGGRSFLPTRRDDSLLTCAFLFGDEGSSFPYLGAALEQLLEGFGPCDFLTLLHDAERKKTCSPEKLLAFLRLSRDDPNLLMRLGRKLVDQIEELTEGTRFQVAMTLRRAWQNEYPASEDDLPLEFGRVFYSLGHYREALDFYRTSLERFGDHATTHHNIGLCYRELAIRDRARECFERALELNPDDAGSRECLDEMRAEDEAREQTAPCGDAH